MRRVIVIAAAGLSLAGCSSFSLDAFKPGRPPCRSSSNSTPQGADALTSRRSGLQDALLGRSNGPDTGFSVTYTMNRFQPVTIPVQLVHGDLTSPADRQSQPGGCRAAAGRPAAETGPEKSDAAEKAETAQGRAGACRRLSVPRPGASPGGSRSTARRRRPPRSPAGDRCTAPTRC